MDDQLRLPLDEEPLYLRAYALTPWGPLEVDRVPVDDPAVDPLARWKVATGLAYVSTREALALLEEGWLTHQTWPG
jgi:hypothetical protein